MNRLRVAWLARSLLSLSPAVLAQGHAATDVTEIRVPGRASRARLWTADGPDGPAPFYSLSIDGKSFGRPKRANYELALRHGKFDPLRSIPAVTPELLAREGNRLFIVQYWTQGIEDYRAAVRDAGGEIHLYLPHYANVVEADPDELDEIRRLPFVRALMPFHPGYKLELGGLCDGIGGLADSVTVNVLTTRRGRQAPVARWVESRGGTVVQVSEPTFLMTVTLAASDLPALAARDDVHWIDRWAPPEADMDIVRETHGANHVETNLGITGEGVHVEVLDTGCDENHPDIQNYLVHNATYPTTHGTSASGVVVGTGLGNPNARGVAPDALLVIGTWSIPFSGGRYAHTAELVNPLLDYQCVVQSNSWGNEETTEYTSLSQEMDLILFDMQRLSICQSHANLGNICARPEAWAKNVIAVGGIQHFNTPDPTDDSWGGGASIGPAADGRIKPDLASYFDLVYTTDVAGIDGENGTDYRHFSMTSAATPIVAGHLALVYQMWHEGWFGNHPTGSTVFESAPYNTTAKALLIHSARQWHFAGDTDDLTRVHQGWGHPDLQRLDELSENMLVIDESDVLTDQDSTRYLVRVLPGELELRATMVYRDPPASPSAGVHRINDLDLTLVAPDGTIYHGNYGSLAGVFNVPGGSADARNTVENVFVGYPMAGTWSVTVDATEVNQDSHVETVGVDVDYALVVSGAELAGGDECHNAAPIEWLPASVTFDTTQATDDIVSPCPPLESGPHQNVWFRVTGTGYPITATTCNAGTLHPDTQIAVFCGDCGDRMCVAASDDDCSMGPGLGSTVSWCSQLGARYLITVGGYAAGQAGVVQLDLFEDGGNCSPLVPCPCSSYSDDGFEENDSCAEAVSLPSLVSFAGLYVSETDADWYRLPVPASSKLVVNALFEHASGNIDLELYISCSGSPVTASASLDDDERIVLYNFGGPTTALLRVHVAASSSSDCNTYGLGYHTKPLWTKYRHR